MKNQLTPPPGFDKFIAKDTAPLGLNEFIAQNSSESQGSPILFITGAAVGLGLLILFIYFFFKFFLPASAKYVGGLKRSFQEGAEK